MHRRFVLALPKKCDCSVFYTFRSEGASIPYGSNDSVCVVMVSSPPGISIGGCVLCNIYRNLAVARCLSGLGLPGLAPQRRLPQSRASECGLVQAVRAVAIACCCGACPQPRSVLAVISREDTDKHGVLLSVVVLPAYINGG